MEHAMKEMSIDDLDLIAQGGMGKIYRINDEQILKVFNNITPEELKKQKTVRRRETDRKMQEPLRQHFRAFRRWKTIGKTVRP